MANGYDRQQDDFNIVEAKYPILHYIKSLIYGKLHLLHYKCKRSRDDGMLWMGGGDNEQLIMHYEDEHVHNIIGHLFFAIEKDIEVGTSGEPVVIPLNNRGANDTHEQMKKNEKHSKHCL